MRDTRAAAPDPGTETRDGPEGQCNQSVTARRGREYGHGAAHAVVDSWVVATATAWAPCCGCTEHARRGGSGRLRTGRIDHRALTTCGVHRAHARYVVSRQLHRPRPDHPVADLSYERIKRQPVVGGLINEYERAA